MTDEPAPDPAFEELLNFLHRNRGFDFTGYKRPSLERRVVKRMQAVNVPTFAEYTDYLEVHPDEFAHLFNTILINVTGFFRDPAVWEYVRSDVVPKILAAKPADAPVRVWSAGCASGEEAYTLAIVLAEALGLDAFRERVKIYGTDVDNDALNQARLAGYALRDLDEMDPRLQEAYFEPAGDRRVFRKDLRRNVIFGRNDLIQDAPISRIDLLASRNCLMYFNAETQARILQRFHFAVNDGGYLVLGKAEMLLSHGAAFAPVDLKRRVFQRASRGAPRGRLWTALPPAAFGTGGAPSALPASPARLREAAFDAGPVPQVVVDGQGLLALANQPARATFNLSAADLGRPFCDLELAHRPVDLRLAVDQAIADGRETTAREAEWAKGPGDTESLDVQVTPLRDVATHAVVGVSVTFTPVTAHKRLRDELRRATAELESAYEELQSSNEDLETTNEELQSTVEELETTNEELQSTNEELETMNEELQTMNVEMRGRTNELNQVNTFLGSILASLRGGVVVVDRDLIVLVWNPRAEDLWGLRADEVKGRQFLNLDIGLPVGELRQPIWDCLAGRETTRATVAAVNRRGKAVRCEIACTPLLAPGDDVRGVILLMDEAATEKGP